MTPEVKSGWPSTTSAACWLAVGTVFQINTRWLIASETKSRVPSEETSDGSSLSEERRRELIRVVRKKVEEGRVALRNVRREDLEALRSLEKNKDISEDAFRRASESLQKLTDSFVAMVDAVGEEKEAELLTI